MTDQRPIDVSTLRDGDIVRAKRGEHGVVEGRWSGNVGSWRIEDRRAGLDLARSHQGGWTITDIIRPVLVKGDRVEWVGAPRWRKASTATVCQVNGDYVAVIRDDDVADEWPIEVVRRLPAAPEPAPIEVGDWWADANGEPYVILGLVGESALVRFMDQSSEQTESLASIRATDTRLDGPPEPAVGSVYVIAGRAWQHRSGLGHIAAMLDAVEHTWQQVRAAYSKDLLATLQIVHTLGVE